MDELILNNPSQLELDDCYRGMENLQRIQVTSDELDATLRSMESIGFAGITIRKTRQGSRIHAAKGKHGPCIYHGNAVMYKGTALAVVDDDHHLLIRGQKLPVCDKTFQLLHTDFYKNLVSFDPRSFEAQQVDEAGRLELECERLLGMLESPKANSASRVGLIYMGPFKLLVLDDGTMVYRAVPTMVSIDQGDKLIKTEGFEHWESDEITESSFFQEQYEKKGTAVLIDPKLTGHLLSKPHELDLSKLSGISKKLQAHLVNLIDNNRKYFLLTGNEIGEELGCCPSELVTEANGLVRSGILQSVNDSIAANACPITFYAFREELTVKNNLIETSQNTAFRNRIRPLLNETSVSWAKVIAKWLLIIFVLVSMILAARKCMNMQQVTQRESLASVLETASGKQLHIILFHNEKRCFQCLRMERYTKEVLETIVLSNSSDLSLRFSEVIIDDPANQHLMDTYGIFSATVAFVKMEGGTVLDSQVILEATSLYRDEDAFKALLESELHKFISRASE